jgi:sigma-E factor negative regulatory protein RseB
MATLPLAALADDDWAVLEKAAQAAANLPLTATYMHQVGGELETFRLQRAVDAGVVRERRESLDGMPREILRVGNELTCYAPDAKALNAAKLSAIKLFPALLPENTDDLAQGYQLVRGAMDRIAQKDCQWLVLKPRDGAARYTQRFCIDPQTALPLKVVTSTGKGEVVEQFAFTELQLAAPKDKAVLKPRYKQSLALGRVGGVQQGMQPMHDIKGLPAGFHLVRFVNRPLPGHEKTVQHYVFSDGFAKVSLFVEGSSSEGVSPTSVTAANGIGVVSRQNGEQLLTVVGDLPEAGLQGWLKNIRLTAK